MLTENKLNIISAVERHARLRPNSIALSLDDQTQLTYKQLAYRAACLAGYLTSELTKTNASRQPARVGILASRSMGAYLAVAGTAWAGATFVPLGLKQPTDRIVRILELCKLSALIVDEAGLKLLNTNILKKSPPLVIFITGDSLRILNRSYVYEDGTPLDPKHFKTNEIFDDLKWDQARLHSPANFRFDHPAYIIYTSGTTGTPKGVAISVAAARHYIKNITQFLGLQQSDRTLDNCELSFDFSVHTIFSTWEVGASIQVLPSSQTMNAVIISQRYGVTVWNSVPSLVHILKQLKTLKSFCLPKIRVTVFGGEPLPKATVENWRLAAPDSLIFNLYGPTEVTVCCLAEKVAVKPRLVPGRNVIANGYPLPGNRLEIFNEERTTLKDLQIGELAVTGDQLALGYLDAPELTARHFVYIEGTRWYFTGDLALRDEVGCFHCLGRIDNQVKIRGHRIELEDIDCHLRVAAKTEIVGTVVWPLMNNVAQGLVGFITAGNIATDTIMQDLKSQLPEYMIPSRIISLNEIPLSTSGKVDRRALLLLLEQEVNT